MEQELYNKIKLSLIKYDFDRSTTFNELWHFSKQFNHRQSFKPYVKYVQNMGVFSKVTRDENGRLKRGLIYKPENDKYLAGEIKTLAPCANCKGTGLVEVPLQVG